MKGKQLRTFIVNNKEMVFNVRYFQEMFMKLACKGNKGIVNYEYEIAEVLFVDRATIHNWRMNVNGPSDIERIQSLAEFLNIKYENLLMEAKNMRTAETESKPLLAESEKTALRNAYAMYDKLKYALKYEYIGLKRTMYNELEQFIHVTLSNDEVIKDMISLFSFFRQNKLIQKRWRRQMKKECNVYGYVREYRLMKSG